MGDAFAEFKAQQALGSGWQKGSYGISKAVVVSLLLIRGREELTLLAVGSAGSDESACSE